MSTLLLALALTAALTRPADAGIGTWTSGGPFGGRVLALAVDPVAPSTLFAGLQSGGIYRSKDSGGTWEPVNRGLKPGEVRALVIDPASPTTVYAATSRGVVKSTDGGNHWITIYGEDNGQGVDTLALAPGGRIYAGSYEGLFSSVDGGVTWAKDPSFDRTSVRTIVTDPSTPGTVYAAADYQGLLRSTDAGVTWTIVSSQAWLGILAIDPLTPTTLYAGTGIGVSKSTDGGATWTTSSDVALTEVEAIVIDPIRTTTLYAATGNGVFRSTDAGATWRLVRTSRMGELVLAATTLALTAARPGAVYAGTYGGVFASFDSGETWATAHRGMLHLPVVDIAIAPGSPSTLFAGTASGLYKSSDAGRHWTHLFLSGGVSPVAVDPLAPTTVYAGTSDALLRSTDGGTTWHRCGFVDSNHSVEHLVVSPTTPGTLYAVIRGGVMNSTDYGVTWTSSSTGLPSSETVFLLIDPVTPNVLYAGTSSKGVYRSTDSGATWVGGGTAIRDLVTLALDPSNPATLYAGTADDEIWKSTDSGSTWARQYLTNGAIMALLVDPTSTSTLYAGTYDNVYRYRGESYWGGLYKSTDSGGSWIKAGLDLHSLTSLAMDPTGVTTVYAGVSSGGVWQLTNGHALSVLPSGDSVGLVRSTPSAIECGATCTAALPPGATVMLTATPSVGATFSGWSGAGCSGTGACFLDMNGPKNVVATFTRLPGVAGYYTTPTCRLFDSREQASEALHAGSDSPITVMDRCAVAATATAVSLNATVTAPTSPGHLQLYPPGSTRPLSSTVSYGVGETRANNAVVPLGVAGAVSVFVGQVSGSAHVILDVNGYFE